MTASANEMVERVARALEIAAVESTLHHPIKPLLPMVKWIWPIMARAAIAAMREPTEGMVNCVEDPYGDLSATTVRYVWGGMIDAALEPAPDR